MVPLCKSSTYLFSAKGQGWSCSLIPCIKLPDADKGRHFFRRTTQQHTRRLGRMLSNTNNWRILTNENEVTMVSDPENKPGCVVICLLSLSYPFFGWPSEHRREWIWISGNLFTENTMIIEDFIYCTFLLEWDLSSQSQWVSELRYDAIMICHLL